MNRKRHSHEAGYIAERMNPFVPGEKVTIYIAAEQGIDAGDDLVFGNGKPFKYAIVCDAHAEIGGEASIPKARVLMKAPDEFCEQCREAKGTNA